MSRETRFITTSIPTIRKKVKYVIDEAFGGIMIWQLAQDVATSIRNRCCGIFMKSCMALWRLKGGRECVFDFSESSFDIESR